MDKIIHVITHGFSERAKLLPLIHSLGDREDYHVFLDISKDYELYIEEYKYNNFYLLNNEGLKSREKKIQFMKFTKNNRIDYYLEMDDDTWDFTINDKEVPLNEWIDYMYNNLPAYWSLIGKRSTNRRSRDWIEEASYVSCVYLVNNKYCKDNNIHYESEWKGEQIWEDFDLSVQVLHSGGRIWKMNELNHKQMPFGPNLETNTENTLSDRYTKNSQAFIDKWKYKWHIEEKWEENNSIKWLNTRPSLTGNKYRS